MDFLILCVVWVLIGCAFTVVVGNLKSDSEVLDDGALTMLHVVFWPFVTIYYLVLGVLALMQMAFEYLVLEFGKWREKQR